MRLAVIAAVRGVLATYAVGSAPSYKTTSASASGAESGHRGGGGLTCRGSYIHEVLRSWLLGHGFVRRQRQHQRKERNDVTSLRHDDQIDTSVECS
jgi:hypothetical protein